MDWAEYQATPSPPSDSWSAGAEEKPAADILFHDQELTPAFLIAALNYSEEDARAAESAARKRDQTDEYPALEGDICPPELDWDA